MTIVWSYGGGVQTTAIAVLILQGKLPCPDLAVMADTGRELASTWDYLNTVVAPALDKINLPINVIGPQGKAYDLTKSGKVTLIPAFVLYEGKQGKLPTWCSIEWKQKPIRRWLRSLGYNKSCDLWLGISMDELERMKPSNVDWCQHIFPLIELTPMNREQCIKLVEDYGWPTPPRSRCWMCPNQSVDAWRHMKVQSPGEFDMAVELEDDLRKADPTLFLHPARIPLVDAVGYHSKNDNFDGCDSGFCFT